MRVRGELTHAANFKTEYIVSSSAGSSVGSSAVGDTEYVMNCALYRDVWRGGVSRC